MNKILTAGFLAATTLSFGAFSPAHAADPTDCMNSGFGGTNIYFYTTLVGLGSDGCYIGDKVYSDFSFTPISGEAIPATATWGMTFSGSNHTLSASSLNYGTGKFNYSYKVSLYNAVAGQEFLNYKTAISSSQTGTNTYTKTLETVAPGTVTGTSSSPGGDGNTVTFSPGEVGPLYFSSMVDVTAGKIDTLSDSITQKFGDPGTQVPGPLPILGAGAAFGFSRRLRKRIKLA
jgi:hypothetical protein